MKSGIGPKLALIVILLLLGTLLLLGLVMAHHQRDALDEQMKRMASLLTNEFARSTKLPLLESDTVTLGQITAGIRENHEVTNAFVLDAQRKIVVSANEKEIGTAYETPDRPGPSVESKEAAFLVNTTASLTLSVPVLYSNTTIGFVVVSFSKEFNMIQMREMVVQWGFLALLLVVLVLFLTLPLASRLTAPLSSVAEGLRGIARGKTGTRIEYDGHDEIGELVASYNALNDELKKRKEKGEKQ